MYVLYGTTRSNVHYLHLHVVIICASPAIELNSHDFFSFSYRAISPGPGGLQFPGRSCCRGAVAPGPAFADAKACHGGAIHVQLISEMAVTSGHEVKKGAWHVISGFSTSSLAKYEISLIYFLYR